MTKNASSQAPRAEGARPRSSCLEERAHLRRDRLGDLAARLASPTTQRVPRSMLLTMNSASRRAARLCQSALPAAPAARVRGLTPMRLTERTACSVLTPRSGEPHAAIFGDQAGRPVARAAARPRRAPRRPRPGEVSSLRASMPGDRAAGRKRLEMAAQLVVRQDAREIHQRVFAGRNPSRAARAARRRPCATRRADRRSAARGAPCNSAPPPAARSGPTSRSRDSGGMHRKLK